MNTKSNPSLKIVVIGGTGLIGSQVVANLRSQGHDVLAASPSSGVNAVTGEGLATVLAGAQVVVDVSNSPSFEDGPVMEFFDKSTRNLLAAEKTAEVRHHVALSVVGTELMLAGGYFRAKLAQEKLIQDGGVPYTIVRATQFFEFVKSIAYVATKGTEVRVPSALMQPMAASDVAAAVAAVAAASPVNGTIEIAGPEPIRMDALVRTFLQTTGDARTVVTDPQAGYFGNIPVNDQSLVPSGRSPRLGTVRFGDWLRAQLVQK